MAYISAFEVIAQPLAPGVPNVPFVQQGTFLQITNVSGPDATVSVFYYVASPNFVVQSPDGALSLFANYIDPAGNIVQIPAQQFINSSNGLRNIAIPTTKTVILGVQYIFTPPRDLSRVVMAGATPQSVAQARGAIQLFADNGVGAQLFCNATVRQVFNNYNANGTLQDVDEAAYSLPIQGGPLLRLTADHIGSGPAA